MTNETKTIARVASTGGIQFKEDGTTWFNRTETCKKYTKDYKAGDTVEVGFDAEQPNLISFMKKSGGFTPKSSGSSAMPKDIEQFAGSVKSVMNAAENKLI